MQGCPMRCLYCHNPDSWDVGLNKQMSVVEIISRYEGVKEFCKGGITVTGGEPLLQIDFVTELFKLAREKKIHTALDTSGITFVPDMIEKFDKLLEYTDLVLLDIKHIDDEQHKILTGHSNKNVLAFARYLSDMNKPMWVRHVVVPNITFKQEYLFELGKFLKGLKNITALDVLPYHSMAISKYKNLGMEYPLENTPQLTKDEALQARNWIVQGYKFNA
jgi:pyruvate formate lyase activating enzyme